MAADKDEANTDGMFANREELEEAFYVLAGSDSENCSYSRGYVKRQALFACNTCTPNTAEPAGVCLACANECHDGHDIFELYTKRNFRCDCGNGKFGEFKCQLMPAKDEQNIKNVYNHNFRGCYCACDRPYPDTENPEINSDEMIQCVVCEDWFHTRHLGCNVGESEELLEMVCEACMNKASFLWTYAAHFAAPPVSLPEEDEEEEVEVAEEAGKEEDSGPSQSTDEEPSTSAEHTKQEEGANRSSPCKRTHEEMTGSMAKATSKPVPCRLNQLQVKGLERLRQGAVFWPSTWRSKLCTCISCKKAYVAAEVQFLMDESDTILAYENKGLDEPFGQHPLMALTNSMDRRQQLEVIYGVNELKTTISAFLDQCIAEKKEITVEAVNQLFEELKARKRRRTNAGYQ
ncbi:Protein mlo2 [Nibea albiflora]|uniref:Protein mlo2 n=1 Tax=Nibea albiflora TaxID=240163 RepID=A0ACB7FHA8_NIBAL|nr:Protein mlo2 [Nibea albiflora]